MSEEKSLILGIDLGTSSVKVALVTCEPTATVITNISRSFGNATITVPNVLGCSLQNNENNQDVARIFNCLHILLNRIPPGQLKRVVAIAVTGQMHGIVGWIGGDLAFNKESKRNKQRLDVAAVAGGCGNLTTWLDRRCDANFIASLPKPTKSEKPYPGFGCAIILWHLKNRTGEFSLTPISSMEEEKFFQRVTMLRKISAGSDGAPASKDDQYHYRTRIFTDEQMPKTRSTSQITPPNFFHASSNKDKVDRHPPWTCAGTIADLLVVGLTEIPKPIMSPQMAASWGYFDVEHSQWDTTALEAAGFPMHLLPEIRPCGEIVGKLAFQWEGIPAGADVFVALGDLQCSVYPYLLREGTAVCNVSTSAQIAFMLPKQFNSTANHTHCDPAETIYSHHLQLGHINEWPYFYPGERIVVAASLNGGNVIDRFVKMLRAWCRQLGCAAMDDEHVYDRLTHIQVRKSERPGMVVVPRLFGERNSADESASVLKIQSENLCLGEVYAAICEGVVQNLVSMAPEELLVASNIKHLYCMGGALKRNPILLQQLEKEYKSLECLPNTESIEACVGVALFTGSILTAQNLAK